MKLLDSKDSRDSAFLRKKPPRFDFTKVSKKEIDETIKEMRRIMEEQAGIGLGANQIGIPWRMFIAKDGNKFYVIFNPEIIKRSGKAEKIEEGCLSAPGQVFPVPRSEKVTLAGFDRNNRKIKIKAWGILARVFQHEVDHLNGKMIIDY
jgi:peptide deformylase